MTRQVNNEILRRLPAETRADSILVRTDWFQSAPPVKLRPRQISFCGRR